MLSFFLSFGGVLRMHTIIAPELFYGSKGPFLIALLNYCKASSFAHFMTLEKDVAVLWRCDWRHALMAQKPAACIRAEH